MPLIHIYAYAGKDLAAKQATAQAIVKAASAAWGAPESAFTVAFQDIDRETWEQESKPILEPLRANNQVVIDHGELV